MRKIILLLALVCLASAQEPESLRFGQQYDVELASESEAKVYSVLVSTKLDLTDFFVAARGKDI